MRASRSANLLVKRSQQGVLDSARNNCAKIFQILLSRRFQQTGQSSQPIEFNGTLPKRYPAPHFCGYISAPETHLKSAPRTLKVHKRCIWPDSASNTLSKLATSRLFLRQPPRFSSTGKVQTAVRLLMGRQSAAPMRQPATHQPFTVRSAVGCH